MNGWSKGGPLMARIFPEGWSPFTAATAALLLGRPIDHVVREFGEIVLIRQTVNGFEVRPAPPAPGSPEVRREVTAIIAAARERHGGLGNAAQILRHAPFRPLRKAATDA